jgi:hypothetical protein
MTELRKSTRTHITALCIYKHASLGALILAMQATQHYRDDEREDSHTNTNIPERRRAAGFVPVLTEPCTDDLNAVGIKDRCERANEARIREGRKSLLTTTITTATSTPAPTPAPTMSHHGFEFAAELAVGFFVTFLINQ